MYDERIYIAMCRSCKGYAGNRDDCILCMHIRYLGQDTSSYDVLPYIAIFRK